MLIEAVTQTTLGNVYILSDNDDLHVGVGVTIQCTYSDPATQTGADAVISWTGTHRITVDGTIIGEDEAINLGGCLTAQRVVINAGGLLISGGDGIVPDADGVIMDGAGSSLVNAGTINAYGSAVSAIVLDNSTMTITNSGSMTGRVSGIWHKFGNGTLNFTNTGTVTSPAYSFIGGESVDNITNRGTMSGTITLGGGNDSYDGRGGSVVGSIQGGNGNDSFTVGIAAETINGGDGIDTLNFAGSTAAITVNLTIPTQNAGTIVVGDSYAGIENLTGGGYSDRLVGTDEVNVLLGNGRIDYLTGLGGDDVIDGGNGKDRLWGGTGADAFVFLRQQDRGDLIYDFTTGTDKVQFEGANFGLGSYAGALDPTLYASGTTNAAQDAGDRFIFRTTDSTLWFDKDGTGATAAIMITDLQTGAGFAAGDVVII